MDRPLVSCVEGGAGAAVGRQVALLQSDSSCQAEAQRAIGTPFTPAESWHAGTGTRACSQRPELGMWWNELSPWVWVGWGCGECGGVLAQASTKLSTTTKPANHATTAVKPSCVANVCIEAGVFIKAAGWEDGWLERSHVHKKRWARGRAFAQAKWRLH